ncbi:hypothetical protein V495_08526 [Pseudogymnoascus sp. VKM F-4514 (FW-929)]|nr:hypothetical protein V495_08526 [Pseudogymnoascus sp. VKM F-4514 (FW-929)]KFY61266.1 hypothetical protein V497_03044 [Pseudogymnoascus sp. VKM F-4516 (FW-969)]
MSFNLKNALAAMVVMAGAIRASPIDEPFNIEATSIEPNVVDIDISEGADMGDISVRSGCSQGYCPDNKAPFDFMKRFWQDNNSEHNIAWYTCNIRINDCGNASRRRRAVTDAPTSSLADGTRIYVSTLERGVPIGSGKITRPRNAITLNGPRLAAVDWQKGRNSIGQRVRLLAIGRPGRGCLDAANIMHTGEIAAKDRAQSLRNGLSGKR